MAARMRHGRVLAPASAALVAASIGTTLWDRKLPGRASRIATLTAGAGTLGFGLVGVTSSHLRDKAVGAATMIVGSTAILFTSQRFMTERRLARNKTSDPSVNVAPTVSTEGAGLAMTIRF